MAIVRTAADTFVNAHDLSALAVFVVVAAVCRSSCFRQVLLYSGSSILAFTSLGSSLVDIPHVAAGSLSDAGAVFVVITVAFYIQPVVLTIPSKMLMMLVLSSLLVPVLVSVWVDVVDVGVDVVVALRQILLLLLLPL